LIAGQRGYLSLVSLEHHIKRASVDYAQNKSERERLEKKVIMMRPGSIDRDLLEERARHVLGYRFADELILIQDRS
jgi:cell division protein FtsB